MIDVYDERGVLVGSMAVEPGQHPGRSIVIPYLRDGTFYQIELVWGEFVRKDGRAIRALGVHSSLVPVLSACRSFAHADH